MKKVKASRVFYCHTNYCLRMKVQRRSTCDDPGAISTHYWLSGVKNVTYEHPIKRKDPADVIVAYHWAVCFK